MSLFAPCCVRASLFPRRDTLLDTHTQTRLLESLRLVYDVYTHSTDIVYILYRTKGKSGRSQSDENNAINKI